MQVLIDTNVILDVLLNREQFVDAAVAILKLSEDEVQKFVSASAVTDIYYMAYQELRDKQFVRDLVKRLLSIIHEACVSEENILTALDSNWSDFEDSVQNAVADSQNYDAVITRNKNDYKKSMLNVFSPSEFLDYVQYDI